nr:RNA polymerase sigma factor [uncultured Sphingomonas sp.]
MNSRPLAAPQLSTDRGAARECARSPAPAADLDALYRTERAGLLRFFRWRNAGSEEAHDLVQESFVRLLRVGAGPILSPGAYLRRIGHNLLRDRAKIAGRRFEALHVPADEASLAGSDQHRLLEARDLLDRIERAMLELSPDTREAFVAHRIDGLAYAAIAARHGVSVKVVEKRIARAMAVLDRVIEQP